MKLFAKLVLADEKEPGKAVAFATKSLRSHDHGKKRVGRPRLNWVIETRKLFWNKAVRSQHEHRWLGEFNTASREHVRIMTSVAKLWVDSDRDTEVHMQGQHIERTVNGEVERPNVPSARRRSGPSFVQGCGILAPSAFYANGDN